MMHTPQHTTAHHTTRTAASTNLYYEFAELSSYCFIEFLKELETATLQREEGEGERERGDDG